MNEKQIEKYMKNLGLTREEAINLYCEDEGIDRMSIKEVTSDLSAEQKKAIKKATQTESQKERKKSTRERKVDETKKRFLTNARVLYEGMGATNCTLKTETELSFDFEGTHYTLKLTKHRPPKK